MTLEKALRGVVLTGVFLIPFIVLYVAQSLFFPFITGKNFAFRIIVEIIASGWLALALTNPAYRPRRSWLLLAFGTFVLLIGISNILGTYPHKSFWSNYERMEGWVTLAHLFAYFVVMQGMLSTEKLWKRWWHTSLAVSVLVGIYGLFQLMGFLTINQSDVRLDATFGNSTYLGVYMMFHVFVAALFLARAWVEQPKDRTMLAWLYGGIIALDSFILFFTSTRGAILGLIGGGVLATLILIALAPRSRVAWRAGVVICGLAVVASGFWLVSDQAWVKKIEPLARIASISDEGLPDARQMNWGMAWKGFQERPILGWGQENFAAVFDKYYDPGMYAQEPWFDRVHNIIFDWLIAGGILGLLAYLSIHFFALLMIWRSSAFAPYERAILTGLLAGYFFYLVFTFDNITSYMFFFALLAYIAVRANLESSQARNAWQLNSNMLPVAAGGAILLAGGLLWFVNADAIAQNRLIIKSITPQPGGAQENLKYLQEAVTYNSVGDQEAREQFSQAAISVVGIDAIEQSLKQEFVIEAKKAMEGLEEAAPWNARFPFFLGILFDQAGAYADAKSKLERAHELSPHKQSIIFELGLNAFARGQNDEAVAYFKEAYELAPEYNEAKALYVAALIRTGNDAAAAPLLQEMRDADVAANPRIAAAYAGRGNYARIAEIWSEYTAKHPDKVEARFMLASAYYSAKNMPKALAELEAIKRDHPSTATQVEQYKAEMQANPL